MTILVPTDPRDWGSHVISISSSSSLDGWTYGVDLKLTYDGSGGGPDINAGALQSVIDDLKALFTGMTNYDTQYAEHYWPNPGNQESV